MDTTTKAQATKTAEPLAAGTYWVGDPCYAFKEEGAGDPWMEWLESCGWPEDMKIMDGRTRRGARVAASGTAFGDGEYPSNIEHEFPVDAGLIGAVHIRHHMASPFLAAALTGDTEGYPFGMALVEFKEPFHIEYHEETGEISVGHVVINTGDFGLEDEEGDDEVEDIWSDGDNDEDED